LLYLPDYQRPTMLRNRLLASRRLSNGDMGAGTWALVTDDVTYEVHKGAPKELLKPGQKVKARTGEDVMTFAMIGPVLEVKSFEVISSD